MGCFMSKKIQVIVGIIVIIMLAFSIQKTAAPLYNEEEASVAVGEVYDFSEDWTIEFENGRKIQNLKLPYKTDKYLGDTVVLTHEMTSLYQSLALSFHAENCAIRIFMDGKPIYEAGYSGKNGDMGAVKPGDKGEDGFPTIEDSNAEKEEAGEITADLPSTIDGGEIRIVLSRVSETDGMYIHSATIAKRDVAVINILRESMVAILCSILVLIFSAIAVSLDVIRMVSGEKIRGLVVIGIIGLDAIIFMIFQTDLMNLFFSNEEFFNMCAIMCVLVLPIMLSLFYYIGFKNQFPRYSTINLIAVTCITFMVPYLDLYMGKTDWLKPVMIFLYSYELLSILGLLLMGYFGSRKLVDTIVFDVLALATATIGVLLVLSGEIETHSLLRENLIDVLITLTILFITIQHVLIIVRMYKTNIEEYSKNLETQVQIAEDAKADALAASEAKGNFLANMSHEIRTPINAVLGMDEMILRESRESQIREYAMDIHTAGQSLLSIINDILDMSKIESGKMEIIPVEYDLSSLIHDLSNMISFRAKAKNLKLEVEVDSDLPARVLGDDVRIKQVVTNILTNAVKYTETGTVWMRVNGVRENDCEIIHFEVEDTGIGIKEEDMSKLFTSFERIEEKRNRNIEGTGLGMSITLQLLAMMDSKLNVESVYGKGSKFYFDIRQKIVDETRLGDFKERIKSLDNQYNYSRAFIAPDAKVLVVDDNVMNRKVFSALLKPTQIQVVEAESGYESIELSAKERYDIIFMDHMMPGMDGIEAFHKIREMDSPNKETPIIILTANAVAGAKESYLNEGFDGFLSKPIVSDKLEAAIKEILPEDMMSAAPDEISGEDDDNTEKNELLENLPAVDGVDWEIAWLHLSGKELMESAFSEFYNILKLHAGKLEGFYKELPEELDNYRIQVHGMKSSAAAVGIIPLAGMAKMLEFAAKDGDFETIQSMHNIFIREWLSYCDKLKGVFNLGEEADLPKEEIDVNAMKALLSSLKESMEDMDIDASDEAMAKLVGLVKPVEVEELIDELKGQVSDLDSDGASITIDKMLSFLN